MRRIGIDALVLILQTLPCVLWFVPLPHPLGGYLGINGGAVDIVFSGAVAIMGAYLLVRFVQPPRKWSYTFDALSVSILVVLATDFITLQYSRNDNYDTIVPLSLVLSLPIVLAMNISALALVIAITRIKRRSIVGEHAEVFLPPVPNSHRGARDPKP